MRRLASVLFWSVLAAAFIGPGTVTTAASAGARFGLDLAWALLFSTFACIVLQEAVARLVIGSDRSLGAILRMQAGDGVVGRALVGVVGFAIVLGCAAYEAGNILGGVAGLELLVPGATRWLTMATGLAAGVLLWSGTDRQIARALGVVVAVMGLAFLWTALRLGPDLGALVRGSLVPGLPPGADLLALGLVGTTVVPYNLFLGAGLAPGQTLGEMRTGLIVAIALGGLISLAVMVVGTGLAGELEFGALAAMLRDRLGTGGDVLFAVGLFAAGFSSAVTAPLAAALTVRSLSARPEESLPSLRTGRVRAVWMTVLGIGVLFGVSGLRPVPVIVLAQALNGLVLPLVATLVLLAANDRRRLPRRAVNGPVGNALLFACVAIAVVLGTNGFARGLAAAFGVRALEPVEVLVCGGLVAAAIGTWVVRKR